MKRETKMNKNTIVRVMVTFVVALSLNTPVRVIADEQTTTGVSEVKQVMPVSDEDRQTSAQLLVEGKNEVANMAEKSGKQNTDPDRVEKKYDKHGRLKSETYYKDGKKVAVIKYKAGKLRSVTKYRSETLYYKGGETMEVIRYERVYKYDSSGRIKSNTSYVNGLLDEIREYGDNWWRFTIAYYRHNVTRVGNGFIYEEVRAKDASAKDKLSRMVDNSIQLWS